MHPEPYMRVLIDNPHKGVAELPLLKMAQAEQVAAVIGTTGKNPWQIAGPRTLVQFHTAPACLPLKVQEPHEGALAGAALSDNAKGLIVKKVKGDIVAGHYGTAAGAQICIMLRPC